MAAVMSQVIPSFYSKFSNNNRLFLQTQKTYIVGEKYCIAHHDDKMCFLPNCRNHILLIGDLGVATKNGRILFQPPPRVCSIFFIFIL